MTNKGLSTKQLVFSSYIVLAMFSLATCLISKYLITNSHFTIDFENLLEFPITSYLYLGGIISLSLLLFLFSNWQIRWVEKQNVTVGTRLLALLTACGLVFTTLMVWPNASSALWTSVGLSSYMILADLFANPKERNLTWLISWMIILSGFLSMVLFDGYLHYDEKQRIDTAKSLFHTASEDAILEFEDVKSALSDQQIFQQVVPAPFTFKIHREEFNEINKEIFQPDEDNSFTYVFNAYDRNGNPMIYETYTSLSYFNEFSKRSDTLNDNLFFDPIRNAYLATWIHEVPDDENSPFTIYLEQYPKQAGIHMASNFLAEGNLGKYDYAYYKNNQLASFSSPYILEAKDADLPLGIGESVIQTNNNYTNLFLQVGENAMIKLSRKAARLIKPVSLFSFIFIFLGLLIGFGSLINKKVPIIPEYLSFDLGRISSLKNKLQFSIIALIIFSFVIIGVVTIYYFQNLSRQYDRDLTEEKALALAMDIQNKTRHMVDYRMMVNSISNELLSLCKKHNVDINIYDNTGGLALSSFSKVYEEGKIKAKLDQDILGSFAANKDQIKLDFLSPKLGKNFQEAYIPILGPNENIQIIINSLQTPITESNSKVSDFVGTLLNIYVFLFLLAGALALAVSNSITQPLKDLGEKIKKLKLGSKNEPLDWQSEDEIGKLVSNYNEMVEQLDDSAKMIAKTERDMAWREMAKQVAHEIKNPLTPMKLSIQYLKRAIEQRPEETDELVDRVSSTLIEQIDNLSNIAGAFSNFGKMPQAKNEKIILNEVVEAIHDLFRKRNDMDINMYEPIDELYVFADKNALVRILNNMVKNAIQAIPTDRRGHIDVKLYKNDKQAVVKISDNGIGIPDHRKEKVFMPNFTTKSSGTGLGLAICANMVESFNGRLYFNSTESVGTDFYLEIPLMHVNDNFEEHERVLLD
ncbi:ATP-binding protein [Saprospiraceae bacterium]|nr:ATP-binding protein [Saprospiraceae bacterium]